MASNPAALITPEQYLEAERRAETKSEYYAGQVFALAGASMRHNLIVANLVVEIGRQIKGRDCIVLPNDMRLRVTATGLYTYPDVTVVCGTPRLEDEHLDTLLNPTLLIEVLSESTEAYDRGRKAEHYRRIDSLEEHLLVAQDEPWIVHYRRQAQREWVLTDVRGLSADLELRSVNCVLSLRDVYAKAFDALSTRWKHDRIHIVANCHGVARCWDTALRSCLAKPPATGSLARLSSS